MNHQSIVLIVLLLSARLAHLKILRWNEMQLYCGSVINEIMEVICPFPSDDERGLLILRGDVKKKKNTAYQSHYHYWIRSQIDDDCCYTGGQGCTLMYILEKYCPFSERVDTTKDVIIEDQTNNQLSVSTEPLASKKCKPPRKDSPLLEYNTIQYLLCSTYYMGCTIDFQLLEAITNSLVC